MDEPSVGIPITTFNWTWLQTENSLTREPLVGFKLDTVVGPVTVFFTAEELGPFTAQAQEAIAVCMLQHADWAATQPPTEEK